MTPSHLQALIGLVNTVRARQESNGAIEAPSADDYASIEQIRWHIEQGGDVIAGLSSVLATAISSDLAQWAAQGLDSKPLFDTTLANITAPQPDAPVFLLAPMRATNGPAPEGFRLELIAGYRKETTHLIEAQQYTEQYIAPFQCITLTEASEGFLQGNCIVLFPESISLSKKITEQTFALFFFSKFGTIYRQQTIPEVKRIFGEDSGFIFGSLYSTQLSEADTYDARCLWGYYHDYAHHTGPRPLNENLYVKLNWYVGLLEETKCDLIATRLLLVHQPTFWREIVEFILFERMFRYPLGGANNTTFDGGTGVLLFEAFIANGIIVFDESHRAHFNTDALLPGIEAIIDTIEAMERLDEAAYRSAAQTYICETLGRPILEKHRFDFSSTQYAQRIAVGAH